VNRSNRDRNPNSDGYVARFAGDAFSHLGLKSESDGPTARRVTAEAAWKKPPTASVRAEVST